MTKTEFAKMLFYLWTDFLRTNPKDKSWEKFIMWLGNKYINQ